MAFTADRILPHVSFERANPKYFQPRQHKGTNKVRR